MASNSKSEIRNGSLWDPDSVYPGIFLWNNSHNGSYDIRRHNISHFAEFQASVMIWRYVAPVILVVGTIGSVLSLLVLCRKSLRVQTTMFYLSVLAVADLMVLYAGLVRLWLEHTQNIYIRLMSRAACKTHNFFVYVSLDLSVWILVAVSVDRCLYVSWPQLARKWCKLRNARITVSTIAVCSALINVHFFWTYDLERHDSQHIYANGNQKCYAATSSQLAVSFVENIWPWIDFCVYCLFPFLFMATSNAIIIKQLVRTDKNMASYANCNVDVGQRSATEQKQVSQVNTTELSQVSPANSTELIQVSQVNSTELIKVSQVNMSVFTSPGRTSPGRDSNTASDKWGKGNQQINDNSQARMDRSFNSCGDLPVVDAPAETEVLPALSMNGWSSNGRKSKLLATNEGFKYAVNSGAACEFNDCFTPNVTTIMSGNCQSVLAPNKRSLINHKVHSPGTQTLENQGVANFIKINTIPDNEKDKIQPHLSLINITSTEDCLSERRLKAGSQLNSGINVVFSEVEPPLIELSVFDELADVVTRENSSKRFYQKQTEQISPLPEIQGYRNEMRLPKSTERMKTLSNRVHPFQQINQEISTYIFTVSQPDKQDACDEVTAFWTSNNDQYDLLVKTNRIDSTERKLKLYKLSQAENINNMDSPPLSSTINRILKPSSDPGIGVNKSRDHNENRGTGVHSVENVTHFHIENKDTDVKKTPRYRNENNCIDLNQPHNHNENFCSDIPYTDKITQFHNENTGTETVNKPHFHSENIGVDMNKSHYHNQFTGVDVYKSHIHNDNIGLDVNKSQYHNENTRMNVKTSQYHNNNLGVDLHKSLYHNENTGINVSKLHFQSKHVAVDANISHYHNENTVVDVNKSQTRNENIGLDIMKSQYHNENIGVDVHKSNYHNNNLGVNVNKSHYHNENICMDINRSNYCNDDISPDTDNKPGRQSQDIAAIGSYMNRGTSQSAQPGLGLPEKSLATLNKLHNTSTTSCTLAPALSRRNTSNVSKTLLAVTIVFWILNAPIVIFIIGQTYITTSADERGRAVVILAWTIVNILQYINVALHFFLYCLTGPRFRHELKEMFRECLSMMKKLMS